MDNINMIWALFVLPCVAGIFKKEIGELWDTWCIYKNRPFDVDRNPDSPDICLMCNPATGQWGTVVIHKYRFWKWRSVERGVTFSHLVNDGRNNGLQERHVGLIEWNRLTKSKLVRPLPESTVQLLARHNINYQATGNKRMVQ